MCNSNGTCLRPSFLDSEKRGDEQKEGHRDTFRSWEKSKLERHDCYRYTLPLTSETAYMICAAAKYVIIDIRAAFSPF